MSWSKKILFLYLGFVALIVTMVTICFGHKTELEYTDYYKRELHFQEQIDAEQNALSLSEPIEVATSGRSVMVRYPQSLLKDLTGSIHFLRSSGSSKDLILPVDPRGDGVQLIDDARLEKGHYKMRITLSSGGRSYFKEEKIALK